MSGHSHWATVKHKKGAADAKKSKLFSKMAREISIAAKDGGGDPSFNPKLRLIIERARSLNMPTDNIDRAVKRGTGEIEDVVLEEILLEAYGPGGVAIMIEGITDNKNRTFGEIKQVLNQKGGKLVGEGAIKWMFDRKGAITIDVTKQGGVKKEDLEMMAIEAGADDFYWQEDLLDVYTKPEDLEKTRKALEGKKIIIESASLDWVAKEQISANQDDKASCEDLFEALDENDAVQNIYSNLKD